MEATTREAFWLSHMQAWETSNQARKAYCRAHDLNHHTFDHWRTKLRRKMDPQTPALTRVPLTITTARPLIELHCGSDLVLHVPGSVTPHWLAELIRGLRAC